MKIKYRRFLYYRLLAVRESAVPHYIVYNTTKTVFMLVRPKQSQRGYSTRDRFGDVELSYVEEFRYLGHVMTAYCRVDMDIVKQFRRQNACSWQYAGQEVLICTYGGKNQIVQVILLSNLWMCSLG